MPAVFGALILMGCVRRLRTVVTVVCVSGTVASNAASAWAWMQPADADMNVGIALFGLGSSQLVVGLMLAIGAAFTSRRVLAPSVASGLVLAPVVALIPFYFTILPIPVLTLSGLLGGWAASGVAQSVRGAFGSWFAFAVGVVVNLGGIWAAFQFVAGFGCFARAFF